MYQLTLIRILWIQITQLLQHAKDHKTLRIPKVNNNTKNI